MKDFTRNYSIHFKSIAMVFAACAVFCMPLAADSTYTVQKGDTLYSISRRYQLTVGELRAANNLTENDVLKSGRRLVIPSADIGNAAVLSSAAPQDSAPADTSHTVPYVVQKGDTLYGIARKNNMTLPELMALNKLGDSALKSGQKLLVKAPDSSVGAQPQPVSTKPDDEKQENALSSDSLIVWPVQDPEIEKVSGKVSGVKLFSKNNAIVKSVRSGTVMYVGVYRGFGKVVFVQSKTGLVYAYTWLGSISVKKGDYVVYGDTVGTAGKDTGTGKPFITFMVFQNGMPMDPSRAPRG